MVISYKRMPQKLNYTTFSLKWQVYFGNLTLIVVQGYSIKIETTVKKKTTRGVYKVEIDRNNEQHSSQLYSSWGSKLAVRYCMKLHYKYMYIV